MDVIFIHDLIIKTSIGVYEWEQQIKQRVILDLELAADIQKAATTDDVIDTLNYKTICESLTNFIKNNHFKLIETLAEQAAQWLLEKFNITELRLSVRKPGAIANAKEVGISIQRTA